VLQKHPNDLTGQTGESVAAMLALRWEPFRGAVNTLGVCIKDIRYRRGVIFQLGRGLA
jgi:hypothetical protein